MLTPCGGGEGELDAHVLRGKEGGGEGGAECSRAQCSRLAGEMRVEIWVAGGGIMAYGPVILILSCRIIFYYGLSCQRWADPVIVHRYVGMFIGKW